MAQIQLSAQRAQMKVDAQPDGGPGYYGRVLAGISGWPPAGRASGVPGEDLGRLVAEAAEQHAGAGGDPEGEVRGGVLAKVKIGDPRKKLIDHSLAMRSHLGQFLPAVAALAHLSSPVQISTMQGAGRVWPSVTRPLAA
jgi:hypothetical protein